MKEAKKKKREKNRKDRECDLKEEEQNERVMIVLYHPMEKKGSIPIFGFIKETNENVCNKCYFITLYLIKLICWKDN